MDISVFTHKAVVPGEDDLVAELSGTYELWQSVCHHVHRLCPDATDEWKYSGDKFGWSFRIKDRKRVIVYLLPRKGYFKVAFVFGQKATDAILTSNIAPGLKEELQSAKVHAEGRGIRIDIRDRAVLDDIVRLIELKLTY